MRCRAVLGSGVQCGREAAAGAELCTFHRTLEFRAQARAFYLARLSAEDLEALADAARVQGLDGEVAILRVLLRNDAHAGDIEGFRRGLASLCRLVQAKHHLDAQATDRLGTRLAAVLDRLGAAPAPASGSRPEGRTTFFVPQGRPRRPEAHGALTPTLSQRQREPAAAALVHELRKEAQAWGRWEEALAMAGPEEEREPDAAREAADLARRYQAGDAEALELLHARLEVTILAVLLHYRALEVPPVTRWEELQERSRTVLADLVRGWHPGVSFLGYFFRTFPSAIAAQARQARRAEPRGRGDVETGDRPPGRDGGAREGRPVAEGPEAPVWAGELGSLPELERHVVVLRGLEGQSLDRVARQVGAPESTVIKLYQRARGRLAGRSPATEERDAIAMGRLVRALHLAAGSNGRLPSRRWAMAAAGVKQREYNQLIARLEGAGAIYGRQPHVPGYLVERDAAATLARVGLGERKGAEGV